MKQMVRLCTDEDAKSYDWFVRHDAEQAVDLPINSELFDKILPKAESGLGYNCVAARGAIALADLFPHNVIMCWLHRTRFYVLFRMNEKSHQKKHVMEYRHDFKNGSKAFDTISRQSFRKLFPDGVTIHLRPITRRKRKAKDKGEKSASPSGRPPGSKNKFVSSRGDRRRAEDAGLIPRRKR